MGSNWKIVKLNEITSKITKGTTPSKKNGGFSDAGINYIKAEAVSYEGRIDPSSFVFITSEVHDKLKRSKLEKDDILFSMAGAYLGKTGIVKAEYLPANTNQALALIRPVKDLVVPNYLHLYLRQKSVVHFVNNATSQSAQPNINLQDIGNLKVRLPDLGTQKNISKVLSDLDDKIDLNNQTNQTLEQMAQALFKSWFVDFDPVFDNLLASVDFKLENLETSLPEELKQKAQRRLAALESLKNAAEIKASLSALVHELQAQLPTKEAIQSAVQVSEKAAETPVKANLNANPKILTQHANTHAHFPSEFEHNEQLGWIPKGWGVDKAEKVADIAIGKTPPRKQKEWFSDNPLNNKVWVSIKDMGGNKTFIGDSSEYLTSESISKFNVKVVPKDSVILSFKLTLGRVCITKCDLTTNEAIAHFVNPKFSMSKEYIYLYLKCFDYGSLGSTSSIATAVNSKIIKAMPFLVPNKTVLSSFKGSIENIFFKMDTLGSESTSLTKLRDTLLPKLISGELQIPDVATDEEVVD